MKKLVVLLICAALLMASLAGCGTPAPAAPTPAPAEPAQTDSGGTPPAEPEAPVVAQPYAGETIRIIFGNHDWTDAIMPRLAEFTALTGIEITHESYPEDQLNQKISVELASGGKNLDVFMTRPLQETKLFIKNGWLGSVDDLYGDAEFDMGDFIPSAVDIFKQDGVTYGVPLVTEREVMYYRKDLLEANNIAVPTTFEELEAAAAALHDPDNGIYGFVARGLSAAAVTQFSSFLRGFGGDFNDENYQATLNTPEAIAAFDFYGRMLREYGPPGVLNMHWQQAAGVYSQGQAAFCTDADSIYKSFCGPDTAIADVAGFAPVPGGKPYNVTSWGLSVPAGSSKAGAAMEFIKWATSKEMIKFAQMAGISSSRSSVWEDPESIQNYPPELAAAIAASNPIGVGSDRPLNINVGKARDVIGAVITDSIEGKDVAAAAEKANAEYQAILDEDFGL